MNIAIIGCGNISRSHLKNLSQLENVNIVGLCDNKKDRADEKAEQYGGKAYYDYIEMLNSEKIDVVHICTPHHLHVEMAVECLKRGIHVLCEKPCAITAESLALLRAEAEKSSAQFGVCFQNRFNISTIVVKDIIDKRKYGEVLGIRANVSWCRGASYYNDDWHGTKDKEGGGVLINQAVHTLDLLTYVYGKMPLSITGHCFNDHLQGVIEVEDTVCARMVFENDVIGQFNATTAFSFNEDIELKFCCEKADVVICAERAYVKHRDGSFEVLETSSDGAMTGEKYWGTGHTSLIRHFYDCLEKGEHFPIDAIEGGKATELFLTIYGV